MVAISSTVGVVLMQNYGDRQLIVNSANRSSRGGRGRGGSSRGGGQGNIL